MTTLGQPKEFSMYATETKTHKHNGEHVPAANHAEHEDLSAAAPRTAEQRKRAGRRAGLLLTVIGLVALGAAAASTWPRLHVHAALAETTQRIDEGRRSVTIISPTPAKALAEVRLPGSTSALQETII